LERARLTEAVAGEVEASTSSICRMLESRVEPRTTALVVGRVQSGKTLSFTTLIAAMADRGIRVVVVLAGTKKLLADQTRQRLRAGLDERRFAVMEKPAGIAGLLPASEPNRFFPPRTLVFVLLKNPAQLGRLRKSLKSVDPTRLGRCLIIDDEADAAGLNTMLREGDQSATYRAISDLRASLEHHWYVQYTATPQANLLVPLVDHLSPDCVHVLEPGSAYVGGDALLASPHAVQEIPTADEEDEEHHRCPRGLATALMQFLVGLAYVARSRGEGVHSMMVHPSPLIKDHESYRSMVQARLSHWESLSQSGDPACLEELVEEVAAAREDLARTCPDLPRHVDPREVAVHFPSLRAEVQVQVVNSIEGGIKVNWSDARGWILIGGSNLDRGFTVEGLAVTYMPRSAGHANVDTLQQRGRFFGYIKERLPVVRVHLPPEMIHAYREIAEHEAHVHGWLRRASADATDAAGVRAMRRSFLLHGSLQPTRREVMDAQVDGAALPDVAWHRWAPSHLRLAEANGAAVEEWFARWAARQGELAWTPSEAEQASRRHRIARDVPLAELIELVEQMRVGDPGDSERWLSAASALQSARARLGPGSVMLMRPMANPERSAPEGHFVALLQGRGVSNDYPGDQALAEGSACLQLHRVHVRRADGTLGPHPVPTVALVLSGDVPRRMVTLAAPSGG